MFTFITCSKEKEVNMGSKLKGCGSCFLFIMMTFVVYKLSLPVFLENFDAEGDIPSDSRSVAKTERTYGGRQLLCHRFEGGLGDLLFQYASLLGMTKDQNRLFLGSGELKLLDVLKDPEFKTGKNHCRGVVRLTERACCHFDDNVAQLDTKKNYDIVGFLQSWKYFKGMETFIKSKLTMKQEIIEKAKSIIDTNYNDSSNTVIRIGIHVETGVFNAALFKKFGYRIAPIGYFQKAINYFRQKFKSGHVVFYLLSDDRHWLWKYMKPAKDVIKLPYYEAAISLAILQQMDHNIISVGPLSWWAGFMCNGEVVYYKDYVREDSGMMYNQEKLDLDYVYPKWIPMA